VLEKWTIWKPIEIPKGNYEVTNIMQNDKGTLIKLNDGVNKIDVLFEGFVVALRVCDEGSRIKTVMEVQQSQSDRFYFSEWPLYMVENSMFGKWLIDESCGIYADGELEHISIVTANEVIDILTTYQPVISLTKD